MAGSKLVKIMQEAGKPPTGEITDLLFGVVTSVSPLKIKIDNRFEVDEKFLILSALVKETVINIPEREENKHLHVIPEHTTSPAGDGPHTHYHSTNEHLFSFTKYSIMERFNCRG